jgi:hypothetical protein
MSSRLKVPSVPAARETRALLSAEAADPGGVATNLQVKHHQERIELHVIPLEKTPERLFFKISQFPAFNVVAFET